MNRIIKFGKIFSAIIAMVMLFGTATAFAAEREVVASGKYQKANWTFYSDGELVISGQGKTGNDWREVISSDDVRKVTIKEGITFISGNAFNGYEKMTDITLPSSLETVYDTVFNRCYALENVYYNGDLADWCSLGFGYNNQNPLEYADNLYINNTLITDLVIPEGVTVISHDAFRGYEKISSVTFPETLISIGSSAFRDCTSLAEINFSESIERIENGAFYGCTNLNEISLGENIKYIGDAAFGNTAYYNDPANWDSGFLYIGNNLIEADNTKMPADCRVFSKTELIASKAFYNCSLIEAITLPDGVEYINDGAFYNCKNMQISSLPESLKEIGKSAFAYCGLISNIRMPDSVESIADYAFRDCKLENVILNDGLRSIGSYAFASNPDLTEINIPQTVDFLDESVFKSSSITDVYYGDTKAEWKRLASNVNYNGITVHYTLRNDDNSVIIQHTDDNFIWEAGNIHLAVAEVTPASPKYDRNGYYNKNMISPVKVLDIKIVDGDGNTIQPLSDENITVKIKAPDEFINMISTLLGIEGELDFDTVEFSNGVFSYEKDDKIINANLTEPELNKFKIVHWFSDGTEPGDYEVFTYDRMEILNGYIILETNHFSEYAVCTEYEETPEIPEEPEDTTATVTGIKIITAPDKTKYTYKYDSLDLSGIVIKVMYSDGTSKIISDTNKIRANGFDITSVGTKTITVEYGEFTDKFEITVSYAWWQWIIRILFLGFIWY